MIPAAGNRPGGGESDDRCPTTMIGDNRLHVKENPVSHKMLWCAEGTGSALVVPAPFPGRQDRLEGPRRPGRSDTIRQTGAGRGRPARDTRSANRQPKGKPCGRSSRSPSSCPPSPPPRRRRSRRTWRPSCSRAASSATARAEVAPMALTSYRAVRPWARAIKDKVVSREMPPWHADPAGSLAFKNDRRLSQADIDTIAAWADGGAPGATPPTCPPCRRFRRAGRSATSASPTRSSGCRWPSRSPPRASCR